jgi:hypothetical protein
MRGRTTTTPGIRAVWYSWRLVATARVIGATIGCGRDTGGAWSERYVRGELFRQGGA